VRVHDADALAAERFVPDLAIGSGSFVALVWVASDGLHTCWGTVTGLDVRLTASDSSPPLLESLRALDPMPGTAMGGVVIDGTGRLIGMVTNVTGKALVASPGWLVDVVSRDLIADGRVVHGWLGVTGETVSTSATGSAVEVISVTPGGAAAKAGVKPGDLIEGVNGEPIRSMSAMVAALYVLPPNRAIVLNVVRGNHVWAARAHLMPAA
jgi:membrane-associated protease RseP (regulator of RpoE activity)